ncbi:PREDICTED: uncharacterized protein LOC104760266 [Camelina sativa]|uniref:Uncharacterized protein LOC104760266 n=1 Tax=Camelina sativa TaxID=90675 RepID=A0ABM0X6H0_CAMSA|nr:PREDICTED: uncharacterized protein LOC104760266 [Camelina sativa]
MGGRKLDHVKDNDNDISGKITFSKRQMDTFKKADALARQARIRMNQAKLDQLLEEVELNKAYEEELRKRQEKNPMTRKYNMKEIPNLNLEDLLVFKKQLENLKEDVERKRVVMEASLSLLELSKSEEIKN